jgi:hypothetical protein
MFFMYKTPITMAVMESPGMPNTKAVDQQADRQPIAKRHGAAAVGPAVDGQCFGHHVTPEIAQNVCHDQALALVAAWGGAGAQVGVQAG